MTTTITPTAPPRAPVAPDNGAAPVVEASSQFRRLATTTPGRLRIQSIVVVALAAIAGLLSSFVVADRLSDTARIADQAAPVIVNARQVQTNLAEANAAAATAFLAGGVENPEQRAIYESSLAAAATELASATRLIGNDDEANLALQAMTAALPRYGGLIETARANNRQGFPVGAAYLSAASKLLEDEIYPNTDLVANRAAERYRQAYDRQRGLSLVFGAVAAGLNLALVATLLYLLAQLRRRFKRTVNPPIALAMAVAVALSGWLIFSLVNQSSHLRTARVDGYQGTRLYLDIRGNGFGAKADEARFLIARGAGASFEASFTSADNSRVAVMDKARASLDGHAAASARSGSTAAVGATYAAWQAYVDVHNEVIAADRNGDRASAVNTALGDASSAFDTFNQATGDALAANQAQFQAEMDQAKQALRGIQYGSLVAVLLIAAAAAYGLQLRINEYR